MLSIDTGLQAFLDRRARSDNEEPLSTARATRRSPTAAALLEQPSAPAGTWGNSTGMRWATG